MKVLVQSVLVLLALSVAGFSATAQQNVCPEALSTMANIAYNADVAANGTCNLVIVINANGTTTIVSGNTAPYDGSEDTLIGVVNNSSFPHLDDPPDVL